MFAVWCPRHRARVLLSTDSIQVLHASDQGISIGYRCTCGYEGVCLPAAAPPAPERLAACGRH